MSKQAYLVVSDLHCHGWSQFSVTNSDGVNSRLRIILNELERACCELRDAGGSICYAAGDLFHVRGQIAPTVLNPVMEAFESLTGYGVEFRIIPGNHDLEGKELDSVGNAVRALSTIKGVSVYDEPVTVFNPGGGQIAMIPWVSSIAGLKADIEQIKNRIGVMGQQVGDYDLIIHAPVDGVIIGIPEHGLTAEILASFGFHRVLAGHYHNHVDFGNNVFSIGATTHQTWGDVGSKAGYLLVDEDKVNWRASHAPKFVDVTAETPEEEVPMMVDGNYVRVKISSATEEEIRKMREGFTALGARGVIIHAIRDTKIVARSGSTVKAGASIEASVFEFIKARKIEDIEAQVIAGAEEVLSEARNAA